MFFYFANAFAGTSGTMPPDSTLLPWNPGNLETLKPRNPGPVKLLGSLKPAEKPYPLAVDAGEQHLKKWCIRLYWYALGRTKGCSKYSKAENNKTPPLYKYVGKLRGFEILT